MPDIQAKAYITFFHPWTSLKKKRLLCCSRFFYLCVFYILMVLRTSGKAFFFCLRERFLLVVLFSEYQHWHFCISDSVACDHTLFHI